MTWLTANRLPNSLAKLLLAMTTRDSTNTWRIEISNCLIKSLIRSMFLLVSLTINWLVLGSTVTLPLAERIDWLTSKLVVVDRVEPPPMLDCCPDI